MLNTKNNQPNQDEDPFRFLRRKNRDKSQKRVKTSMLNTSREKST